MPESPRSHLSHHELRDLLGKLDEVLEEAQRLREEVSRQLADQNRVQQQRLSVSSSAARPRPRR